MNAPRGTHLPSIALLAVSGLGLLVYWGAAAAFAAGGLYMLVMEDALSAQTFSLWTLSATALFFGLLLLPPLALAFLRLIGHDGPALPRVPGAQRLLPWLWVLWPVVLLLGHLAFRLGKAAWLVLPPLQILAVCIPLVWFFHLGSRGLEKLRPPVGWGLVAYGLSLSPILIIGLEMVLLAGAFVLLVLFLMNRPDLMGQLGPISEQYLQQQLSPELLFQRVRPLLMQPGLIAGVLAFMAGIVPVVEEILKPAALWLLAGKRLTPAQGFVGGLLCGGVFTLMETLGNLSAPAEDMWLVLVATRAGTGLLHMVASGLVGWGLASALGQGRYLRLVGAFISASLLHSLWNVAALVMGIAPVLYPAAAPSIGTAAWLGRAAPWVLAGLMLLLFAILGGMNQKLRAQAAVSVPLPPASDFTENIG